MWPVTNRHTVMFATKSITLNKYYMNYCKILDNIKFLDIIILERKPFTKTRSSSPNDFMFRLTNISLALLYPYGKVTCFPHANNAWNTCDLHKFLKKKCTSFPHV